MAWLFVEGPYVGPGFACMLQMILEIVNNIKNIHISRIGSTERALQLLPGYEPGMAGYVEFINPECLVNPKENSKFRIDI